LLAVVSRAAEFLICRKADPTKVPPLSDIAEWRQIATVRIVSFAAGLTQGPSMSLRLLFTALSLTFYFEGPAHALDPEEHQAQALLTKFCSRCHAIGRTGKSPHAYAPPFRDLGENKLYDESFSQRLQDGLSTIHPDMPTFRFSQRDAGAVIEYLRAIQSRPQR
jgi:mono/diheme cytochrome c family protein